MKINLWNASLVPGEEERKDGQGFWDRSVTGAAKKKPWAGGLGTRAGENLTPSQRRNALMAALGTMQVNFPAAWRAQNVLEMVQNPASPDAARWSRVTLSKEGCSNPKGRLNVTAHQQRRNGRFFGLDQGERFSRRVTLAQAHRSRQSRSKL